MLSWEVSVLIQVTQNALHGIQYKADVLTPLSTMFEGQIVSHRCCYGSKHFADFYILKKKAS